MPRPACTTVKTVPKKGSTALGKNQPRFIDGGRPTSAETGPSARARYLHFQWCQAPAQSNTLYTGWWRVPLQFSFSSFIGWKTDWIKWVCSTQRIAWNIPNNFVCGCCVFPNPSFVVSIKTPRQCSAIYVGLWELFGQLRHRKIYIKTRCNRLTHPDSGRSWARRK